MLGSKPWQIIQHPKVHCNLILPPHSNTGRVPPENLAAYFGT